MDDDAENFRQACELSLNEAHTHAYESKVEDAKYYQAVALSLQAAEEEQRIRKAQEQKIIRKREKRKATHEQHLHAQEDYFLSRALEESELVLRPSTQSSLATLGTVKVQTHLLTCPQCTFVGSPGSINCTICLTKLPLLQLMERRCVRDGCIAGRMVDTTGSVSEFCSEECKGVHHSVFHRTCGLPGCQKRVEINNGHASDFCSLDHKNRAWERRLLAPTGPEFERVFMGGSGDYSAAFMTKRHPKYEGIKQQFMMSWKHGVKPSVQCIFQIRNPPAIYERYVRHLGKVGNEKRRFHGSSKSPDCTFGFKGNAPPCTDKQCAVCNICSTSFSMLYSGRGPLATGFSGLRFGPGLYFSATSSKSNDYAVNSSRTIQNRMCRCMFLCKVALGKTFETDTNQSHLTEPPNGFDSVSGVVGKDLNFDEEVVYTDHAAIPSYLIVYRL